MYAITITLCSLFGFILSKFTMRKECEFRVGISRVVLTVLIVNVVSVAIWFGDFILSNGYENLNVLLFTLDFPIDIINGTYSKESYSAAIDTEGGLFSTFVFSFGAIILGVTYAKDKWDVQTGVKASS